MSVASSMVQTIEIIFTKLTPNAYFVNSKKLSPIVAKKKALKIGFDLLTIGTALTVFIKF